MPKLESRCSSTAAFPYSDPSLTGIGTNSISGVRCQVVADPNSYAHNFYNNFNTIDVERAQNLRG